MIVLGVTHPISWNPAAALLRDGRLVAMAEEERFNRVKYAPRIAPHRAVDYVLAEGGVAFDDLDAAAVGWERAEGQKKRKRYPWEFLASRLPFDRRDARVRYVRHHLAHAAAAFFASDFDRAGVVSLDGYGGSESGLLALGEGPDLKILHAVPTRASWGHFYGKITELLGFTFHRDEGKVMGLAAYGTPQWDLVDFVDWDREPPAVLPDRFRAFLARTRGRRPGEEILPAHRDLAATAQGVLERAAAAMVGWLGRRTGVRRFCLGGGLALNCAMNGALRGLDGVDDLFVNPASNDAGTAFGAAAWVHRERTGRRPEGGLAHAFYGPAFGNGQIREALETARVGSARQVEDPAATAAALLARGKIVGWFQGRMEFGPRALGNRSILADPGVEGMADRVNDLKGRERWRPLAPSVPQEAAADWVEGNGAVRSPFMLMALRARDEARRNVPAVVHVDGSMRVQTVDRALHPRFWALLKAFEALRGYPVVLNTSFNLAGQPIVCTPLDALGTFFASGLDALVLEDWLVTK